MALVPGDRVHGRYRVLRALGHGGMASVHLVQDEARGTELVLKELRAAAPPGSAEGHDAPELLAAFRAEFALLVKVVSPYLTKVHDFGSEAIRGGLVHFYTAEWVDGASLGSLLGNRAASGDPARLLPAVLDAMEGLEALHVLSVRHGDFTPDNVLVRPDGRGVLIDLGCARHFADASSSVSGTPGFVAPEVLATGKGDARSDLYAVGITLERIHRLAARTPSPALARIVARLADAVPARRFTSVHEVLEALGRKRAPRGTRLLSKGLFGRDTELETFDRWLDTLRANREGPRVLAVHGPAGAGTTRLIRELVGRASLSGRVVHARASDRDPVGFLLSAASGITDLGASVRGALSAARALSGAREPVLLALEEADRLTPDEVDRLAAFARSLSETGNAGLLLGGLAMLPGASLASLPVGPLDAASLRRWTGGALSEQATLELLASTGGLPAKIELALSEGHSNGAPLVDAARRSSLAGRLARLAPASLSWMALLVALDGELDPEDFPFVDAELDELLSAGWIVRDGPRFRIPLRDDVPALRQALAKPVLSAAHRRAAERLSERSGEGASARTTVEIVRHLTLAGAVAEAEARLRSARGAPDGEARLVTVRLLPLLEISRDMDTLCTLGEAALAAQEPGRALVAAARALTLRPSEPPERARLLAADALIRTGKSERAERTVRPLLREGMPVDGVAAGLVRVARARIQRGDHAGAAEAAERGLALVPASSKPTAAFRDAHFALKEARGVAASYLGHVEEAIDVFGELYAESAETATPRERCRILGQRAILAFRLGRVAEASEDHARALSIAESAGLDDLVAACSLNLGTAEQQLGLLGRALANFERGLVVAHAVGRVSTELTLRYNLSNLQAELGDFEPALAGLDLLERRAAAAGFAQFAPAIALVRAEIAVARGQSDAASGFLDAARAGFQSQGLSRELLEVELVRSEVLLARRDVDRARERAEEVSRQAAELGAEDLALRAELLGARVALASGDPEGASRLEAAARRAGEAGHKLLEAKLATELAAAKTDVDPGAAPAFADAARKLWDRMGRDLPDTLRERIYDHPRRLALSRFTRSTPRSPASGDAETLRRLLSLTRRLNSSLSLERVLDYAVEAAVELTRAERGFLLLLDDGLAPRVAAARDGGDPTEPPSSSIVSRAIQSEEAVLTTDAQTDPRFAGRGSVHSMRLKSVLCVPIATPAGPIGALYVDSRVQRGRFAEADRELLSSLADHAAIAVGNARLHTEIARSAAELAEQKAIVERLSRSKDREIVRLKGQVEARQRALELRYDYSQIVGRGAAMRRILEQLDRIIDSTANVLVEGESGTGKELVARAIHFNGERRAGPFVGVNCAALPETLLESELFGHVRGAFTGADRDKKGLLVEANGGTLFLDELGEMPPSTQAKLLRVIQEREVRPVGAARAVPLDVRLVCATHRDLVAEVAQGRFREDLYYRVAVVGVKLPPLRDRVEDIPDLARAILERLARDAGRPAPSLDTAAMLFLSNQPWPGNVRQLENTLTRAFVLGAGERLGASDLAPPEVTRRPEKSRTRREFEDEERTRILELLRSSRWNVSFVARTLGIPRNSFYRKLTKYGLARDV